MAAFVYASYQLIQYTNELRLRGGLTQGFYALSQGNTKLLGASPEVTGAR